MFSMTDKNINDLNSVKNDLLKDPTVGGIVFFQGVVRNHNEGKDVTSLEYDSYSSMANKVGKTIMEKAKKEFEIVDAVAIHRYGHLSINDTAVWVIVTSHHRKEAFEACQYIIDRIKDEVPIWKREHYVSEKPQWVACHRCQEHAAENHHKHDHKHAHEHHHHHCK